MHMICTQSLWTMPPAAIGPVNDHVAMAEMFPSPLEFKDFDRNPVRPFYTYGLWLSNKNSLNSELDVYLMMVLVRCLAADPEDRPSLRELLRWCSWRENDAHWDDQQESVRDWSDANINQPAPVRSNPSMSLHFGWLVHQADTIYPGKSRLRRLQLLSLVLLGLDQTLWSVSQMQQKCCASAGWRPGRRKPSSPGCAA